MVKLTKKEKEQICLEFAKRVYEIRKILHMSQTDFGERIGSSKSRIVEIENGRYTMSWSQYTSIICLCLLNRITKEYLYLQKIISPRVMQFMQQKGNVYPPEIDYPVNPAVLAMYQQYVNQYISEEAKKNE